MNPDRVHTQRLSALDFWPGPITIEPISGGITNHNYLVRTGEKAFVARLCVARELLGIDRRNEIACQLAAHALGVAPAVAHHESGVLVSEYLPARTLGPTDVRDPAFVPRLAALLRRLHDGWDRLTGEVLYFSVFQTVRTYAATARALGARLPDDTDALLDDARRLSHRVAPFVPVLCHNDMLPANILDDGARVWLVDWEYAGVGHPLFDLAGASANCQFPESLDLAFLAAYRGTPTADPRDVRELRIFKALSLLREALWSAIQTVASDIAFDYQSYADTNFLAYRSARRLVEPDE
jgi:thiamine kinase-like enzyme